MIDRSDFIHPYEALCRNAQQQADSYALAGMRLGEETYQEFRKLNWAQVLKKVQQYAVVLQNLGLQPGDRVAFQSKNQMAWVLLDWACAACGLISVPIYVQSLRNEIEYILKESEAKLFVAEESFLNLSCSQLSFNDLEKKSHLAEVSQFRVRTGEADEILTIIYTSGTTGEPKGVIHTARNIYLAVMTAQQYAKAGPDDRFLSYLPLSHVVERILCDYTMLYAGSSVYFVDPVEKVAKLLPSIRPTIFAAVPRIWDLVRHKIERQIEAKPWLKVFPESWIYRMMGARIRRKLGLDQARLLISGAAKLGEESALFFGRLGMKIIEGYGLTETCGISVFNHPTDPQIGTVGKVFPGVEMKIAEDGEVLLKADYHFQGYFRKESLTQQVLKEGWFHTGDIGELDADGNLMITDRKKDIFKTSNGKYIAPQPIECRLKSYAEIHEAMVYGENQPHCVALICLTDPKASETRLRAILKNLNQELVSYERVHALGVVGEAWSVEGGELTPSMKLKRRQIIERHADKLKKLYEKREPVIFFDETPFFFDKGLKHANTCV